MSTAPLVDIPAHPLPPGTSAQWLESHDGVRLRLVHFCSPSASPPAARGAALLVPGWTEPSEKYAETALDLMDRGFDVWCYDPRGQGLSQRGSREDLRGFVDDYQKYIGDLQCVTDYLQAERLLILGHSMGGLTTLSWLLTGGEARVAVLSAPATRILRSAPLRGAARATAWALKRVGQSDFRVSRSGRGALQFEGNKLTSDPHRHAVLRDLLLQDAGLDLPDMYAALVASMHTQQANLHRKNALQSLTVPTLIVSAGQDQIVDASDHPRLARRSPNLDYVLVEGAEHEIL
ncbi:MAG: alpha/beta hydrolase, partial [Pseudomonadota bacterium]